MRSFIDHPLLVSSILFRLGYHSSCILVAIVYISRGDAHCTRLLFLVYSSLSSSPSLRPLVGPPVNVSLNQCFAPQSELWYISFLSIELVCPLSRNSQVYRVGTKTKVYLSALSVIAETTSYLMPISYLIIPYLTSLSHYRNSSPGMCTTFSNLIVRNSKC